MVLLLIERLSQTIHNSLMLGLAKWARLLGILLFSSFFKYFFFLKIIIYYFVSSHVYRYYYYVYVLFASIMGLWLLFYASSVVSRVVQINKQRKGGGDLESSGMNSIELNELKLSRWRCWCNSLFNVS